jgi:hypothetical protein
MLSRQAQQRRVRRISPATRIGHGWRGSLSVVLPNSPIVCTIHLMEWHARLDREPDHVFRSGAARKGHDQIGLAFIEHPLIAQWGSFLSEFVPFALRQLIGFARLRPSISHFVSAARVPWISTVKGFSVCGRSNTLVISPTSSNSRPPQTRTLISAAPWAIPNLPEMLRPEMHAYESD